MNLVFGRDKSHTLFSALHFLKTFNLFVDFSAQANVCCLGRVTPVYHSLVLRTFAHTSRSF